MISKVASLPPTISQITRHKATETPFTGKYDNFQEAGTYLCRQCGLALFRSQHKFSSYCGWPSFDEEIPTHVKQVFEAESSRTEIICARCQAHLGHVFLGEGFTLKNTRHCVNSLSLDFVADLTVTDTEEAIIAGGCFWGVEYYMQKLPGVLKTEAGYTGGHKNFPTYEEVCSHMTGHLEAVRILFDNKKTNYETIIKHFFEIHDPTQANGQGPDIGEQYLSAVFYYNNEQKIIAEKLIQLLAAKGYRIVTRVLPVTTFWPAETYHQDYYSKVNKTPYCHSYGKKF